MKDGREQAGTDHVRQGTDASAQYEQREVFRQEPFDGTRFDSRHPLYPLIGQVIG